MLCPTLTMHARRPQACLLVPAHDVLLGGLFDEPRLPCRWAVSALLHAPDLLCLQCGRQIVSGRQMLGRVRERGAGALPHSRPDPNPALAGRARAGAPGLAAALDGMRDMRGGPCAAECASGGPGAAQGASGGACAAEGACGQHQFSGPGSGGSAAAGAAHEAACRGTEGLEGASAHAGPGGHAQEPLVLELEVSGRVTAVGVRRWAHTHAGPSGDPHGNLRTGAGPGEHASQSPNQGPAPGDSAGGWELRTAFYDGAGALVAEEAGGWLWRHASGGDPGAPDLGGLGNLNPADAAGAAQHSVLRTTTPLVRHISFLARDGATV